MRELEIEMERKCEKIRVDTRHSRGHRDLMCTSAIQHGRGEASEEETSRGE